MPGSNMMQGGCLCNAVKLSTTNKHQEVGACHCGMCRKWGGSSLLVIDCGSDISFTGEENITVYPSSEWGERGFCNKCGSHLFYRLKENNQYYIPAGIFNNESDLVLKHQVFIDEKPEYYSFDNETKNMTGEELFAQFAPPSSK